MTRRRGYTLIECLAAIALIAATFTTVAVATGGMYRASRHVGRESAAELELARLAAQLRADAHQAAATDAVAGPKSGGAVTLVDVGGNSVEYKLKGGQVERTVRQGENVRHRDGYRLPTTFAPRWQVERQRPLAVVSLVLEPEAPAAGSTLAREPIRIDAAVGLLRPDLAAEE